MKEIANEGHIVEFIDIDKASELVKKYNISSVPTTIIEENGIEVDRIIGTTSKEQVLERIGN